MAFDDESASFQPQSPGQALDEETASRSLASLAEPEVMAFDDDESEVMTTEGGAELLSSCVTTCDSFRAPRAP